MAEGTELGVEYISIIPSMVKFAGQVSRGVSSAAKSGAKSFADQFSKQVSANVKQGAEKAGKEAGAAMARAALAAAKSDVAKLGKTLSAATDKQADALGKLRVAEAKLNELRNDTKAKASQITAAEEALAAAQRRATTATNNHKAAAESLTKAQQKEKDAADAVAKSQDEVAKKSSAGARLGSKFSDSFNKGFKPGKGVENELERIDGHRAGKSLATRFGVGFNGAFGGVVSKSAALLAATLATVGVGTLIKDSVNLEATFSQTMNTMAAVAKVPADQIKNLSDLAIQMGADTTFSAGEAANAMLELAKGGLDAATIQSGALAGTLTLAAAGGTSLETAATIASNALNTFGLEGKDMAGVAAALAGGANASSASVESLGQALQQVGPGASNAGLSLQDTVAVLSSFDAAGIKGSDAGTSLKTMLTRLVPQTDKAASAMEGLGLKFTDATGNFLPISNIAQQLQDKLSGLSDEQQTLALSTIFGSDATRAATVLMKEGAAGVDKFIAATKDQNAATEVAGARMSGTAGAIESFKGSVETATLQLGRFIAPAVQAGLAAVTQGVNNIVPAVKGVAALLGSGDFTKDFRQAFNVSEDSPIVAFLLNLRSTVISVFGEIKARVTPAIQDFVQGFQNLVPFVVSFAKNLASDLLPPIMTVAKVFVGLALLLIGQVANAFQAVTGFIKDNSVLFQSLAVAVLAGLAAYKAYQAVMIGVQLVGKGVLLFTKAWAASQAILNAIMSANPILLVVIAIAALAAGLVYAFKHSKGFHDAVVAAFNGVKSVVLTVVAALVTAFHAVVGAIQTAVGAVVTAFNAVKSAVSAAVGFLGAVWSTIVGVLMAPINVFIGILKAIWPYVYPILVLPFYIAKAAIEGIWAGIKASFLAIALFAKIAFAAAWSVVNAVLVQPLIAAWHGIQKIWGYITAAFTAAKNWVVGVFSAAWRAVSGVLSGPLNTAKDVLGKVWTKITGAFTTAKDWVTGTFSKAWNAIKDVLAKPINDAKALIGTILGAGKDGVQFIFTKAVSGISTIWNKLQELAKIPIRFIINTVLNNGLIDGFNWIAGKFDAPTIPHIPLPKGFADGGRIPGAPSAVDNTWGSLGGSAIPLATGEFIVNARQTAKNLPLLRSINNGEHGYANGGLLGKLKGAVTGAAGKGLDFVGDVADFTKDAAGWLKKKFSGPLDKLKDLGDSAFAKVVTAVPRKIGDTIVGKAKDLLKGIFGGGTATGGPNTPPGNAKAFRGVRLNERTIGMLLAAERILGKQFHITQGSYSTRVAASGSTHAGGGAMDTNNAGAGWPQAVSALRSVGFAAWWRRPNQGPWNDHIHSIARGDSSASAAAKAQMASFARGGDGLGGRAAGGLLPKANALIFDNGGYLPTGVSTVINKTGHPEPLGRDPLTADDLKGLQITIDAGSIGTLTGFVTSTADARITKSNKDIKRKVGQGVRK